MDEKKIRKAIAWIETKRKIHKYGTYKNPTIPKEQIDMIEEYYNLAIEALEKQLPKKPIEYEDKYYACPACGNVLMHKWEKYPTILEDKKNGLPCCLSCLQVIDWSEE